MEEDSRDGSLQLSSAYGGQPQAELVAQLYPSNTEAAKAAAEKSLANPAVLNKITSALWDVDSFDPFQQFKVDHEKCAKLTVFIDNGSDITKGWFSDLVDKPDPYVKLRIAGTPNGTKMTTAVSDCKNPVWNQAFTFLVPDSLSDQDYFLDVRLMDEDVISDDKIGMNSINLRALNLTNGETRPLQLRFGHESKINIRIRKELDASGPDVRYSLALCDDEKTFLLNRREKIFNALRNLLGANKGPQSLKQVPVIAVLGSGGGFRAMVGLSAVFSVLQEMGIMDCIYYVAGLSGSTWYLSYLYSHPDFPDKTPRELVPDLREVVSKKMASVIAKGIIKYMLELKSKFAEGRPVTLTDLFGHIIGDMVLEGRKFSTLSGQRRAVHKYNAPLPLYACLNVKHDVPANVYQDWVEFSPFEIGMPKYGAFMKTEDFGNKFYVGKIVRRYPEVPLHYHLGVWGSGFCILLKRFFKPWSDFKSDLSTPCPADCDKVVADGIGHNESSNVPQESSSDSDDDERDSSMRFLARRVKKKSAGAKFMDIMKMYLRSLVVDSKVLETRKGRAGLVFNPLRGLSPQGTFPLSPFTPTKADDELDFKGFYEHTKFSAKKMYMVDAGLNFNIPFPVLLRPQRGVELYLSFDFTDRGGDESPPFEELKLAEQWARLNHLPFPPVTQMAKIYEKEEMREFYLFEDPSDEHCPVVIHFVLCNKKFRRFKAPGVKRETEAERRYADFKIYDAAETPYSTFNFHYTGEQFDKLHELVEFNVRLGAAEMLRQIEAGVERKKKMRPQRQRVHLSAVPRSKHANAGESAKVKLPLRIVR